MNHQNCCRCSTDRPKRQSHCHDGSRVAIGVLPDTQNCGLRMPRECWKRFPRDRLQRKPLISDPGMHYDTCVTHAGWGDVPGIPGACNPQVCVSGKRPMVAEGKHSGGHSDRSVDAIGRPKEAQLWYKGPWGVKRTFIPHLLISENELPILANELAKSVNELPISVNHLPISVNQAI